MIFGVLSAFGVVAGLLSPLGLVTLGLLGFFLGVVGYVRGSRGIGAMTMVLCGLELAFAAWAILSFATA